MFTGDENKKPANQKQHGAGLTLLIIVVVATAMLLVKNLLHLSAEKFQTMGTVIVGISLAISLIIIGFRISKKQFKFSRYNVLTLIGVLLVIVVLIMRLQG